MHLGVDDITVVGTLTPHPNTTGGSDVTVTPTATSVLRARARAQRRIERDRVLIRQRRKL